MDKTVEAKSQQKNRPRPEQIIASDLGNEQTALTELPAALIGATGDSFIEGQSARLGDVRFQTIQLQAMASQIGWAHGNAHLWRLVSSLPHNGKGNGAAVARKSSQHDQISRSKQTTGSETDGSALGEEGLGGGVLAFVPATPPKNDPHHSSNRLYPIQRQEEAAEDAPTEAEKKIALAKAKAAQQEAAKTSDEGKQQVEQSKAEKTVEKQAGQVAAQKALAEKSAAGQTKAVGEGDVNGEVMAPEAEAKATPGGPNGAGLETVTAPDLAAPDYKAPATPEADPTFQATLKRVKGIAAQEQSHAPAKAKAKESQAAAVSPTSEKEAKAQGKQVEEMGQAETPGFDAKAFKAKLMQRIQALTPKSAEEADNFKKGNPLGSVKDEMQGQVTEEKEASQGPMETATEKAPDTGSIPDKRVTPLKPPEPGEAPPDVDAEKATPKPKGAREVETPLKQESQRIDQEMAEGNVSDEQLAKANEPSFQSALDAKKDAQAQAEQTGVAYRETERGQISQAQGEAVATAQEATQGMHGDRARLLEQVAGQQGTAKGKDEEERAKVASDIQKIYSRTKTNVERILSELDSKVDKAFDDGAKAAKQVFEDYVEAKTEAFKEERYGGWFGWARWAKDKIAGMPAEVNVFYQQGRDKYLQKMDAVIDNVVSIIGRGLTEAKAEIAKGKKEIQEYVTGLPKHLQKVGQEAASDIQDKFAELEDQVNSKQDELVDKLAQKYQENLQAIDTRIEELKEANRGLVDKVVDAVKGVIETIKKLKRMLDTVLAKIADVVSLIIDDPIGFLGKLIDGIKQGFNNFVANIGTYLQKGLITWLTSAMQGVDIQMPDDIFSLPGIFSLVMQILGLSWAYIRKKAVKLLGEKVVAALEVGFEPFKILVTEGPAGLWEWVKGEFNDLKEKVMDAIKDMIITEVIKAGVKWVLGLLNPVGAFIKACMAIYEIIMFFVNNAERILKLIEAIVDAAGAIARGAISTGAKLVEDALGRMVPLIIGFLASLLSLGDLGKKVQGIINKVRLRIDKMVDKLLMKAKKAAKKLFGKGKQAAGKIVEWWKKKRSFKTSTGEQHTLYFGGQRKNARLKVKSEDMDYAQFLAKAERALAKNDVPSVKALIAEAKRLHLKANADIAKGSPPAPATMKALEQTTRRIMEADSTGNAHKGTQEDPFWIMWHKDFTRSYPLIEIFKTPEKKDSQEKEFVSPLNRTEVTFETDTEDAKKLKIQMNFKRSQLERKQKELRNLEAAGETEKTSVQTLQTELDEKQRDHDAKEVEKKRLWEQLKALRKRARSAKGEELESISAEKAQVTEAHRAATSAHRSVKADLNQIKKRFRRANLPNNITRLRLEITQLENQMTELEQKEAATQKETEMIGITPDNQVFVGKVVGPSKSGRQDKEKNRFIKVLEKVGFNWSGYSAEHVIDQSFGGGDSFENLWPIKINPAPNQRIDEQTGKQEDIPEWKPTSGETKSKAKSPGQLAGSWFKIFGIKKP